jgi:hypothetical protein
MCMSVMSLIPLVLLSRVRARDEKLHKAGPSVEPVIQFTRELMSAHLG